MTYQTIRFARSAVKCRAVVHAPGGVTTIYCDLPGGTPWLRRYHDRQTPIDGAPRCETFGDFKRFVRGRFSAMPAPTTP